jgi:hypothetical protein
VEQLKNTSVSLRSRAHPQIRPFRRAAVGRRGGVVVEAILVGDRVGFNNNNSSSSSNRRALRRGLGLVGVKKPMLVDLSLMPCLRTRSPSGRLSSRKWKRMYLFFYFFCFAFFFVPFVALRPFFKISFFFSFLNIAYYILKLGPHLLLDQSFRQGVTWDQAFLFALHPQATSVIGVVKKVRDFKSKLFRDPRLIMNVFASFTRSLY